jgi:hypothetical protein
MNDMQVCELNAVPPVGEPAVCGDSKRAPRSEYISASPNRFVKAWRKNFKMEPPSDEYVFGLLVPWTLPEIFYGMNRTREHLPQLNAQRLRQGKPAMCPDDIAKYVWGVLKKHSAKGKRKGTRLQ